MRNKIFRWVTGMVILVILFIFMAGCRATVMLAPPPVILTPAPPPPPPPPGTWVPGHYEWDGRAWIWIPGYLR